MLKPYRRSLVAGLVGGLGWLASASGATEDKVVPVGILHSLSGTMAISETSLRDVLLFAFDEINANGGVMGCKIKPIVVDGASDWPLFADRAEQLLQRDHAAVVFGCWTSISRKSVLPVFERNHGLLFYAVQYEGEELSKNIFYTAEAVNQQATPAVDFLIQEGKKRFFLIGTDYVYPRTTNLILFKYLRGNGIPAENIGGGVERNETDKIVSAGTYVPFGHTDFTKIVADIKQFAAGGEACVINTINGDSNLAFFKAIAAAGLTPSDCTVVSFSLAEDELRSIPAKNLVGNLGCWTYFQSLPTPANKAFLARWNDWLRVTDHPGIVKEGRVVDSPMVLSYNGVYLWKAAVEAAGSFEVEKVRAMLESGRITFNGPGGRITMQANHHATKNVYVGETKANGQFRMIQTFSRITGEPFLLQALDGKLSSK